MKSRILRTTGLVGEATMREFRAACREWCTDTGTPGELVETALAHTVGGDEGAYFRSALFEWRRKLMDSWAAYFTSS